MSGWSLLCGALGSALGFVNLLWIGGLTLVKDCNSCALSKADPILGYYLLLPILALVGAIISNSRARLGSVILIATGVPAIFSLFVLVGYGLPVFSIYTLVYFSWVALLFYAGYLSLKGRKARTSTATSAIAACKLLS